MNRKIMRGEIYYADLDPVIGSEQGGIRPVLIIQNNTGNKYSQTVVVAPITSRLGKHNIPTHVRIKSAYLPKDSIAMLEQIRTVDKSRIKECIGNLSTADMKLIEKALLVSVGID